MSFIKIYENYIEEVYVLDGITRPISSLVFTFSGTGFKKTLKVSYSFDCINWSDYYDEAVISSVLSNLSYNTIYLKVHLKVEPTVKGIHQLFFHNIIADGISVNINSVEFVEKKSIVSNTVNANLWRYHDDLTVMHEIRRVLNKSMSDSLGLDVTYFKTANTGVNHTLKTYTIHNTESVQELRIILDDSNTPTNELDFDEYMAYYNTFEAYIDKTEWNEKFGEGTYPTPKDSFFLHSFNKMVTISKVLDERDFLDESVCWKVSLIKYAKDGSVNTDLGDVLIDNFVEYMDGAGLTQEIDEQMEYREAAGIGDSVNDTLSNEDTTMLNIHSNLLSYTKGMTPELGNITHRGLYGLGHYYLTLNGAIESEMLRYKVESKKYKESTTKNSLNFWYRSDDISEKPIYKTYRDGMIVDEVSLTSSGLIKYKINSGQSSKTFYTSGTSIDAEALYNVHINKSKTIITITISKYESGLQEVQTLVSRNPFPINELHELSFMYKGIVGIGMIKMSSDIIKNGDIESYVFAREHNPDIIFDDCKNIKETNQNTGESIIDTFGYSSNAKDC